MALRVFFGRVIGIMNDPYYKSFIADVCMPVLMTIFVLYLRVYGIFGLETLQQTQQRRQR